MDAFVNLFGNNPVQIFLARMLISGISAVLSYWLVGYALLALFRKTSTDVDDVILGISRRPAILLISFFGLRWSFAALGDGLMGSVWIGNLLSLAIVLTVIQWTARLFVDVLVYYVKIYAQETEAVWDDVLVPVLERVGAPLIYLVGAFVALQAVGLDLTGLWVAIGGGAFVLAFALQGILSDFFAGLILLVDTPFRPGDVIVLPDTITKTQNITAVVKSIGIRVTHLFNVQNYTDMYIPNGTMARSSFFNANRPTTNLAATVGFAARRKGTNPNKVVAIIRDAVVGHPDIVGDPEPKLEALRSFKGLKRKDEVAGTRSKKLAARDRLRAEIVVNRKLEVIHQRLQALISRTKELEKGGLDAQEVVDLSQDYDDVLEMVGLSAVEHGKGRRRITKLVANESEVGKPLLTLIHSWLEAWLTDPNLFSEDRKVLHSEWEQKLRFLTARLTGLYDLIHHPEGRETRIDDNIQDLVTWLDESFKRTKVMWQEPQVWLTSFNETFIGFNVRYYVDNIRLEHWRRPWRVESELTKDVMRRFKIEGVKLPKAMYRSGDEKTQPGVFIT